MSSSTAVSVSQMTSSTAGIALRYSCGFGGSGGGLNSRLRGCSAFVNLASLVSAKGFQYSSIECFAKGTSVRASGGAGARILCSGEGSGVMSRREVSCNAQTEEVPPMSEAEQAGWEQRQKEAAETKDPADPFQWRWTLNWDSITPNIIVGSCPRSPGDIDRMVDEAGIDAILNLQSGLCFDALKIPFEAIRKRAVILTDFYSFMFAHSLLRVELSTTVFFFFIVSVIVLKTQIQDF